MRNFAKTHQFWRKFVKFRFRENYHWIHPGVSVSPKTFATINKTFPFSRKLKSNTFFAIFFAKMYIFRKICQKYNVLKINFHKKFSVCSKYWLFAFFEKYLYLFSGRFLRIFTRDFSRNFAWFSYIFASEFCENAKTKIFFSTLLEIHV